MLRSFVTLPGLILAYIATAASQKCQILSPPTVGTVYENAETDTLVTTLEVCGTIDSEIRLELTGEMATYFRLDGKNVTVIDGTALDRSSSGLAITGSNSIKIGGRLYCFDILLDPGNHASYKSIDIRMTYTNKEDPRLLSDSSVIQNEFTIPNTVIITLTADDGEDTGWPTSFTAIQQDPSGYLEVTSSGDVILKQELDYEDFTSIVVTLEVTDEGFDSTGAPLTRTIEREYTVNITDYDDTNPIFTTCNSADCIPPVYTANVSVQTTGPLTVQPQEISAFDGDTAIDEEITYSLVEGSPEYDTYFEIDSSTGVVRVKKEIDSEGVFILAVRAQQSNAANRFAIAYLQVDAYVSDESKPVITVTAGDIGNAVAIEIEDDIIYVLDESTLTPIILHVSDGDDANANLIYVITPDYFQVSRVGEVYAFHGDLFSPTKALIQLEITALNIDASTNSPNRISESITMSVVTVKMTTQATTEVTTVPDTTQQTNLRSTTDDIGYDYTNQVLTESTNSPVTTHHGTTARLTDTYPVVPRSTLVAVASVLSSLLLIALCVTTYLLFKSRFKKQQYTESDIKVQSIEHTYEDVGYLELEFPEADTAPPNEGVANHTWKDGRKRKDVIVETEVYSRIE